jgi:hypothetical protein
VEARKMSKHWEHCASLCKWGEVGLVLLLGKWGVQEIEGSQSALDIDLWHPSKSVWIAVRGFCAPVRLVTEAYAVGWG